METVRVLFGTWVLVLGCLLTVRAQSELPLRQVGGQSAWTPRHLEDSYNLSALDGKNQRVLFLLQDSLWAYDLRKDHWNFIQPLNTPKNEQQPFELVYDTLNDRLLFWSESVGKVYEWKDGYATTKRLDHSFNHQNQYQHTPLFDPVKGTIYAFGGYGLWHWVNMITRYAPEAKEWFVVAVKPGSPLPPPRTDAIGFLAPGDEKMYIIGGTGPVNDRQDDKYTVRKEFNDLWAFSLKDHRWEELGHINLPGLPGFRPYRARYTNQMAKRAYDAKRKLFYFTMQAEQKSDYAPSLYCFDTEKKTVKRVVALSGQFGSQYSPLAYYYDRQRDRLLVFALLNLAKNHYRPILIFEASRDTLQASFRNSGPDLLQAAPTAPLLPTWGIWSAAAAVILLAGGAWFLRILKVAKKPAQFTNRGRNEQPIDTDKLLITENRLMVSHKPVEELFEKKELELIRLLARAFSQEQPFMLTDEIEEALWSDQTNLDYIRKLRNRVLHNINETFREVTGMDEDCELVLGRRSEEDRRKMEYGLNPDRVLRIK